jgi:hypothetical protein
MSRNFDLGFRHFSFGNHFIPQNSGRIWLSAPSIADQRERAKGSIQISESINLFCAFPGLILVIFGNTGYFTMVYQTQLFGPILIEANP